MPVLKIFIHFIWSTKNRAPYLIRPDIREQTWDHIRINAKLKNISLLGVSGHSDHCHCLFSMGNDQMISKIIQLIKGESSYWINKSGLILNDFGKDKFDWQDDYFGETVSPHLIPS
ncbi:MAG: transposase, partial [Saprospiraceae bacterium]